ncbi:MAG: hypothetical protein L6Q76_17865, partial [Polyangiaceae bacterium]|nr:hypothetical protein [Polyangiaceae bacterium]
WNGLKINGLKINGLKINGLKINGLKINGTTLSGVALDDFAIIDGTALSGTTEYGAQAGWQDFIGATMIAVTEDGAEVAMRIDAITPRQDPELLDYVISYKPEHGPWTPACGTDEDGEPIAAIPLAGVWNYEEGVPGGGSYIEQPDVPMFTFACETSVLEKCVTAGYKPWGFAEETKGNKTKMRSLRPLHQACTRMMRADYCGDGMPHTMEHTLIDMWDALGIEEEEQSFELEAEWTVNGASCTRHVRYTGMGEAGALDTLNYIAAHCPSVLPSASCGSQGSTFNTSPGWKKPLDQRSLFRNSSCAPPQFPNCGVAGMPEE